MPIENQKGQSMIEYLIIVGLVAVGSIFVMEKLGHTISVRFANITNALQGKTQQTETAESINADDIRKRGLNDFFQEHQR